MTTLSRRLKNLEAHYQVVSRRTGEQARNLESEIKNRVLAHLCVDELRLLLDVTRAHRQGSLKAETLATDQWAALVKSHNAALNEECRKAGFASSEAFYRRLKAG